MYPLKVPGSEGLVILDETLSLAQCFGHDRDLERVPREKHGSKGTAHFREHHSLT